MTLFEAIVLAIVEGLTEFIPVSSTGHLILAQSLLQIESTEFVKTYIISIQFGAILAVVVLYYKEFFKDLQFYLNLFIAFFPAALLGLLFHSYIEEFLSNVLMVVINLFIVGIIMIFIDKLGNREDAPKITPRHSFFIGLFQVFSMLPGVSRSAATIIGGLAQKLSRKQAAEFSFFLAVPTITAASGFELYKNHEVLLDPFHLKLIILGNFISFIIAILVIKSFISFLVKFGFKFFGWYRIILSMIFLILMNAGITFTNL
ncbi:MAG: undecaprenyl-diphosphate phosphatase [Bacteroidales bacterium]|nr:undecaprenyl-diphosphate phosphatase [Bacteroidales bacterium]